MLRFKPSKQRLSSLKKNQKNPSTSTDKDKDKKKSGHEDWQFENPNNKTKLVKRKKIKGEMKDVTYHWCKNHNQGKGMWVRHLPADCKNKSSDSPPSLIANGVVLDQEQQE